MDSTTKAIGKAMQEVSDETRKRAAETRARAYDVTTIQDEMTAAGSHWWEPSSMRFFGTRTCGPVYHGDNGIYFATSEQPPHGPRAYTVRKYDPATKEIDTIGELCEYETRSRAITAARNAAGGNAKADGGPLRKLTESDVFHRDCQTHGKPEATRRDCEEIRRLGKRHSRFMVDQCNGIELFDANGDELPRLARCREQIRTIAAALGAESVRFSGDPRGCTVKLKWKDGATNDWGNDGWCVPGA